jgi:sRNA-binding carbon storage regulator CsrA
LLTVVAVRKGTVRLAFEAPASVAIDREEVRRNCKDSPRRATKRVRGVAPRLRGPAGLPGTRSVGQ